MNEAQIYINGTLVPGVRARLELTPTARVVLYQRVPNTQPLVQFASLPGEPARILRVEKRAPDGTLIWRCVGPAWSYQQFYHVEGREAGEWEFMEVAYTELAFEE